ncbi:MAG TPA: uridine diphosphate-N-acetylglucosamine-binding protein YvcK [Pyrinomonadaceae bacterium]|nr:uridine diphosphate-N-acetylglucosamine-binding protein YvcK [Pyrinomonadaceae bacterium]
MISFAAEAAEAISLERVQGKLSVAEKNHGLKLVAIGGGTGLSTLLAGLKRLVGASDGGGVWLETLSAIVTVSDDGGSSGRLREELQMLPPGDIRNCMVALSEDSTLLSRLFRYRFRGSGGLGGHSFGNLFLAALTEVTGDFVEAVRLSSEVLASKGRIYPATINDVRLVAELEDSTEVRGETQITASRTPIRRLRLEPEQCLPLPEALAAIRTADAITIGPGSLYTSILPNLLVARVADAIGQARAIKIFICNLMTQPGETDGYTARRHLETVKKYAPEIVFDYVILNDHLISPEQAELYAADGAHQIGMQDHMFERAFSAETEVVRTDLLDDGEKVRHNPDKLARVVLACCEQARASSRQASIRV